MRMRRASMCVALLLLCLCATAEPQKQKVTVQGKLVRVMAIGAESTGWAIQLDPDVTVEGKHSVEAAFRDPTKIEGLQDKRVEAVGKLVHKQGVETGDRLILNVSSIKEQKVH
jgi:hypothetical protein